MTGQAPTPDASSPSRPVTLRRTRPLPGGRAVIGAFLVVAAVFGVFAFTTSSDDTPSTRYVVVSGPVDIGSHLSAADLRLDPIDLPPATAATAFTSLETAVGAVALAPMTDGTLLSRSSVLLGDGTQAGDVEAIEFSFAIERDHAVDGALQPGEIVDVLATYTNTGGGYTEVVTRAATVISIGDQRSDTIAAPGTLVVTLALARGDQVLALAHAKETAAVTLVRATRSATAGDAGIDRYRPESAASGEPP